MKIAIVGGGIAGLTAAHLLRRRHDITLFERTGRLGGNAYTLDTRQGDVVDIAVAAFGRAGYKNFYRLLDEIGVVPRISAGSFMSCQDLDTGKGVYIAPTPAGLLAQRFAMLAPSTIRSLWDLNEGITKLRWRLDAGKLSGQTLEEALAAISEMRGTARLLFLCALCLLSSMSCDEVLAAPAEFFIGKLRTHHDVISPKAFWSVRCIPGGTRTYVEALAAGFRDRVELNSRLRTVLRREDGVDLLMEDGTRRAFDEVVLACNADQALALLAEPTDREREVLGAWRYKDGRIVVHTDHSAFPPRPLMQAYTFLYRERGARGAGRRMDTSVNGCLWFEPGVRKDCDYVSSQHPNFPIRADRTEFETVLRTPIFDFAACKVQRELPSLNGTRHTWYCGSHFGYGLHEDAVTSASAVARGLGAAW